MEHASACSRDAPRSCQRCPRASAARRPAPGATRRGHAADCPAPAMRAAAGFGLLNLKFVRTHSCGVLPPSDGSLHGFASFEQRHWVGTADRLLMCACCTGDAILKLLAVTSHSRTYVISLLAPPQASWSKALPSRTVNLAPKQFQASVQHSEQCTSGSCRPQTSRPTAAAELY
jgi:hypothetical protein